MRNNSHWPPSFAKHGIWLRSLLRFRTKSAQRIGSYTLESLIFFLRQEFIIPHSNPAFRILIKVPTLSISRAGEILLHSSPGTDSTQQASPPAAEDSE